MKDGAETSKTAASSHGGAVFRDIFFSVRPFIWFWINLSRDRSEMSSGVIISQHPAWPDMQFTQGELFFECTLFLYSVLALFLQYLNIYKTLWWLPKSYWHYSMVSCRSYVKNCSENPSNKPIFPVMCWASSWMACYKMFLETSWFLNCGLASPLDIRIRGCLFHKQEWIFSVLFDCYWVCFCENSADDTHHH